MASTDSEIPPPLPALGEIPPRASLASFAVGRFTEDQLQKWRSIGDPAADDVATELTARGDLRNIHDLLGGVREHAAASGGVFGAFMDEAAVVPQWADFKKMERGQKMITTYLPFMNIALGHGSLVGVGGQFPKMGDVVRATGMLSADDYVANQERLARTGRFVRALCTPGDLLPGREGHDAILKIRLLHGAVRSYVPKTGQYFEDQEVPVNQHDLAITLGLFGYICIRSLRRLGVRFAPADVDSYILLWRYVGHVLGIQDGLLPRDFADQQQFFLASTHMMTDGGEASAPQVLEAFENMAQRITETTWGMVPGHALVGMSYHLLGHLGGPEYLPTWKNVGMTVDSDAPWLMAGLRAAASLTSFIDQRLPLGQGVLSAINQAAMRVLHGEDKSEHMLRSRL